jgi:glycosyltransferase involved in cell wall biosynthesis
MSGRDVKMRLAVVVSHPIQYLAPLFRRLARQVELKVFYAHRATQCDQAKAGFGVGFDWDVDLLSGYESVFLKNTAAVPSIERFNGCDTPEIGRHIADGRFDAVLVEGWYLKCLMQAIFAAKLGGIPVLLRGDSQLPTQRSRLRRAGKMIIFPMFLRLFNGALYAGERSRIYWDHYHYPAKRMFFSPHGVDDDWFKARATRKAGSALRKRAAISPQTKVALFAGKLVPYKRPLDLVAAIARLRAEGMDVCLLVAGAGELAGKLALLAQSLSVPIHMLGFCNQSEMPATYAAADIMVLPSDGRETWGLVANEALACGCPLVLSDAVGAAPDLAGDGSAGVSFPLGDTDALARAIGKVLLDPPTPQAVKAKSAVYSLETAVNGIVEALAATVRPDSTASR